MDNMNSVEPLPSYKEYLPPFQQERISCDRVDPPSQAEFLQCPICLLLFDRPTTLTCCGTSYCIDCLQKCFWCPSCRSPLPANLPLLKKNITLSHMVENLFVTCPSHTYDTLKLCQERVKIKDLGSHWKSCPHIIFTCKCKELISSTSFLEGLVKCRCPEVKCENCDGVFQERLYKYHSDDCMRKRAKCKYCGSNYDRGAGKVHLSSECFSYCPYKDFGCDETNKMSSKDLKAHCEYYKNLHNYQLLLSMNQSVADSFLKKTSEFNDKIPDSRT